MYSNDVCTWGEDATGGGRTGCPSRCTIADSNRSIPRHLRSLMNAKQTRRFRSLMGAALPSFVGVLFFSFFFNNVRGFVKKRKK